MILSRSSPYLILLLSFFGNRENITNKTFMNKYLFCLLLLFASCGSKIRFHELNFVEDRDRKSGNIFNVFVRDQKGNAFDGTAWSSDGKTLSIEVDEGILVCSKIYYDNGKIASYNTLHQHIFYDKEGKEISEEDFKKEIDSESMSHIRMAVMELDEK